jgi:hypothetical protein
MPRRLIWFPGVFGVTAIPDLSHERIDGAPVSPTPLARAVLLGPRPRRLPPGSTALAAVLLMAALFAVVAAIA